MSCLVGWRTATEGDAAGADRVGRGWDDETEERACRGGGVGSGVGSEGRGGVGGVRVRRGCKIVINEG